jgi:hypothetical protein
MKGGPPEMLLTLGALQQLLVGAQQGRSNRGDVESSHQVQAALGEPIQKTWVTVETTYALGSLRAIARFEQKA